MISLFYMFIDMMGTLALYGGIENLISSGFSALGLPSGLGGGAAFGYY
jgi:hypothetical protein